MKPFKFFNPRGSQLLIIISIILILNVILTSSITYVTMRKNLRKSIIENDLPLHSAWIYSEIKQALQSPIFASTTIAKDLFIRKWLKEGEKEPVFISRYLKSVLTHHNGMTCFLVSEKTRTYYNAKGAFPLLRENPDAQWYFDFINNNKESTINISLNVDMNNLPTVFINYKILSEKGKILGVAGIGLSFSIIPELLSKYSKDFNRDIYFINSEGKIVARSSNAIINSENIFDVTDLSNSFESLISVESNIHEFDIDDEPCIMQSMYLPELDWWLLCVQRESVTLNKMNQMIYSVIAINLMTILLTLVLVFLSVSFFQKHLKSMATTDPLTGIFNRQIFDIALDKALLQYNRSKIPVSLLLIDIDFFKTINDSLGHLEGDQVLIKVAQTIQSNIRKADELNRWGGEEFVVLAYSCNHFQAIELAEKIRVSIENSIIARYPDGNILTISIGVSEVKENESRDALIHRADSALYTAKSEGRNCVRFSNKI